MNKRVAKQLDDFENYPQPGLLLCKQSSPEQLIVKIVGPQNSPYQGAIFQVLVTLPQDYPFRPPKMKFITPIYHPNISKDGGISMCSCAQHGSHMIDTDQWGPSLTVAYLMRCLREIIANPNALSPLQAQIGKQCRNNKSLFDQTVKQWISWYNN